MVGTDSDDWIYWDKNVNVDYVKAKRSAVKKEAFRTGNTITE